MKGSIARRALASASSLALAALLLFAGAAHAKLLYVNNSGTPACSDATTYAANGSGSPWCTVGRASWGSTNRSAPVSAQAAQAGDTVYITAGIYSEPGTGNRRFAAYEPTNTGTNGNPITFEGVGTVRLRLSSGNGPTIGMNDEFGAGRGYTTWRNFTIEELHSPYAPDTGLAVIWASAGNVFDRLVLTGQGQSLLGGDNYSAVRIEGVFASNNVVRNSTMRGWKNGIPGTCQMNGAAIMVYYAVGTIIENNEISGNGTGIYMKGGDHSVTTIRKNYIWGNCGQIAYQHAAASAAQSRIYQNIMRCIPVYDPHIAQWIEAGGIAIRQYGHNITVANNTIVGCNGSGISWGNWDGPPINSIVQNNIITQSSGETWSGQGVSSLDPINADRNVYYTQQRFSVTAVYTSLADWRTALGGCLNPGNECSSVVADPLFVNAAAFNYRLQAGSTVRTVGTDLLDLDGDGNTTEVIPAGVYVTGTEVIGPSSSGRLAGPGRPRWRPLWWGWWMFGPLMEPI